MENTNTPGIELPGRDGLWEEQCEHVVDKPGITSVNVPVYSDGTPQRLVIYRQVVNRDQLLSRIKVGDGVVFSSHLRSYEGVVWRVRSASLDVALTDGRVKEVEPEKVTSLLRGGRLVWRLGASR